MCDVPVEGPVGQQADAIGFDEISNGLCVGQGEDGPVVVPSDHGGDAHHGVDLCAGLGREDQLDLVGRGIEGHDRGLSQGGRRDHGLDVVCAEGHGHGIDHADLDASGHRSFDQVQAGIVDAAEPGR